MTSMQPVARGEHPRPDFERDCWQCLNGAWDFAFDSSHAGEREGYPLGKGDFPYTIQVPFAYQTPASGIGDVSLHDTVWYRRSFDLPEGMKGKRVFLHFGAVDYEASVYLNGSLLGSHTGGYTPFCFDITPFVQEQGNLLVVKAVDTQDTAQPRGKQSWTEGTFACWYWPTTGIWQSVWLETVGPQRIESLKMTPDIDEDRLTVEVTTDRFRVGNQLRLDVSFQGKPVKTMTVTMESSRCEAVLSLRTESLVEPFVHEVYYWTPETPHLYQIELTLLDGRAETDRVRSYFGMRQVSVEDGKIFLNHQPCYLRMVLDQGYWRESGLTPPSDDAIRRDVELTKAYGFNGARKHQKIEDPRYYYWCDRLGLLVWGELPSGFQFNDREICNLTRDMAAFIRRDYNHPCLMAWVPLNESWGVGKILTDRRQQHLALSLYSLCKALDPIRLVSTNDGWEMVTCDIAGVHDYAQTGEELLAHLSSEQLRRIESLSPQGKRLFVDGYQAKGSAILVTEYGGIALATQTGGDAWGYAEAEQSVDSLIRRYADVTETIQSIPEICGFCYTQLTDAYQEVNGLLDCDHQVKIPVEAIAAVNRKRLR